MDRQTEGHTACQLKLDVEVGAKPKKSRTSESRQVIKKWYRNINYTIIFYVSVLWNLLSNRTTKPWFVLRYLFLC